MNLYFRKRLLREIPRFAKGNPYAGRTKGAWRDSFAPLLSPVDRGRGVERSSTERGST
ncbi:hypothetical protein MPLSOD_160051 [Mesorhizobium sp. SOD10]|nr:hypothetical protein MPLSOD_160051 [Mesorhizobium sp. SOD10]